MLPNQVECADLAQGDRPAARADQAAATRSPAQRVPLESIPTGSVTGSGSFNHQLLQGRLQLVRDDPLRLSAEHSEAQDIEVSYQPPALCTVRPRASPCSGLAYA